MAKNKELTSKNVFFIILFIFIISIIVSVFIYRNLNDKKDNNDKIEMIKSTYKDWNITRFTNNLSDGEYAGAIFNKNYTVSSLPDDLKTILVVNDYISKNKDFYNQKNEKKNIYSTTVSKDKLYESFKNMFGPDIEMNLKNITYGCDRKIQQSSGKYIISSKLPDSCGILSTNRDFYKVYTSKYKEDNKNILVYLKVAYIEVTGDDDIGITYNAYTDNSKRKVIKKDINYKCFLDDNDKSCYDNFIDYIITLKQASDNNYYFYSIEKV